MDTLGEHVQAGDTQVGCWNPGIHLAEECTGNMLHLSREGSQVGWDLLSSPPKALSVGLCQPASTGTSSSADPEFIYREIRPLSCVRLWTDECREPEVQPVGVLAQTF